MPPWRAPRHLLWLFHVLGPSKRALAVTSALTSTGNGGAEELVEWELDEGYDGFGPVVDKFDHDGHGIDGSARRLNTFADHEDVPTNITGKDAEVEADWSHDFEILKPIVGSRGFDVSGADHLCKLPCVYCTSGYRRRVPSYTQKLMGDNDAWVGMEYQLVLTIKETGTSRPSVMNPTLFNLRRVGFFQVYVNSGAMPAGLEQLKTAKMIWIEGNGTHGLEGGLPAGFWQLRARMFLLATMGPKFTAHLDENLPMCEHLDYRVYLYRLQGVTGSIQGLSSCRKVVDTLEVFLNPRLGGNVWSTALEWDALRSSINFWGSDFQGSIPFASSSTRADDDVWVKWCRRREGSVLNFRISQTVNGPLPAGLDECAALFRRFVVDDCALEGPFPLNFAKSSHMIANGIKIFQNKFTGPIPDIPPQLEEIDLHGNRWSGNTPASWGTASSLAWVDLSDCGLVGAIPDIPPTVATVNLAKNRLTGQVPQSWFGNNKLETIDLSDNNLAGPIFAWGWVNPDANLNYDVAKFLDVYAESPAWPLRSIKLDNNPLGVSVGFLLGQLSQYELMTVQAANCSLHGFASSEDLKAQWPKAGGGVEPRPGSPAFSNLKVLDLSDNAIENVGYDDLQGTSKSCWQWEVWSERLPRLEELYLQRNPLLRYLNPGAFRTTQKLDVRGAPLLVAPPIVDDQSYCTDVFKENAPTCSGETWSICLWRDKFYVQSTVDELLTCSGVIAMKADSSFCSVTVSPETFGPEELCTCKEGSRLAGDCVIDTASDDTSSTVVILVVVGSVCFVVVCLVVAVILPCACRSQRTDRAERSSEDADSQAAWQIAAAAEEASSGTLMNTPSDLLKPAENEFSSYIETEQVFGDMNLTEIVEIGLKEHWLIPKTHINFVGSDTRAGGFGEVKKATLLGSTDVAVKIPANRGKDLKFKAAHAKALVNEMRLFRRIRHPNIVLFHGVMATGVEGEGVLCLVLEWIQSGDFGNYVKTRRMNGLFKEACRDTLARLGDICHEHKLLIDVARGMQYLHGQLPPIMHRDLKPGNVLVELPEPPRAKLADFGLSTLLHVEESQRAGTSSYMAPEVAAQTLYNLSADVFSFGCICLFVLTANRPVAGRQQHDCRKFLTSPELPTVIAEVGVDCLHKEPSERLDFEQIYRRLTIHELKADNRDETLSTDDPGTHLFFQGQGQGHDASDDATLGVSTTKLAL